jgi:hypothetical protein
MPHAVLKLVPGVNTQQTQALNESSGVSESQLVRFFPDPALGAMIQKLGGWTRFFGTPFPAIVRALWAWEDLNDTSHLAVGTQTITSTGYAQLSVITNGAQQVITPTYVTDDVTPAAVTIAGNSIVTITDNTTTGITSYDSVYITTQIAIGGLVLFGLYACDPDGTLASNAYTVQAVDILGNPLPAPSSSSSPVLPTFTTVSGSTTVTVTLPAFTYALGDTFPVLIATTIGGITFFGNYVVQSILSSSQFTIIASPAATSSATGSLNGGNAQYIYSLGQGSLPGGTGYGIGGYGTGGYGTGNAVVPPIGTGIDAIDWTLDNWGEILIACPDRDQPAGTTPFQPIYQWDVGQPTATIITAAPPVNDGIFVAMPQRQIVAWGSTETGIQDPLLISWCDVNNFNQWISLVTNQAGNYRIPKGSRIVGAVQGPQQGIIWTDIDVWSMQYIGPPLVYGFNEIGSGCGLIGRKAAGSMNGIYYWMAPRQFFSLGGAGVLPIECPVWDVVFQNVDTSIDPVSGVSRAQKIRFAANSLFGELVWYYPSLTGGTGEVDSYVKYNVPLGIWDYGTLGRTAWVDQSVLGPPIGADPNSLLLYQHETSNDADGQAMSCFAQTGYFALAEGDFQTFVDLIWPDFKWRQYGQPAAASALVQITFFVADYPGDTPVEYGPYSVTQATEYFNTRLRGRLVSIRISSQDLGSWWRIGALRYRFSPDGKF